MWGLAFLVAQVGAAFVGSHGDSNNMIGDAAPSPAKMSASIASPTQDALMVSFEIHNIDYNDLSAKTCPKKTVSHGAGSSGADPYNYDTDDDGEDEDPKKHHGSRHE
jgi:hypothetical protein